MFSPLLALALAAAPNADVDPSLQQLAANIDAAWNAHDADVQTALFAKDGTVLTPRGTRAVGHAEVRKISGGKGPTGQTTSSSVIDGVQHLTKDVVLLDVTQTLTGPGTKIMGSSSAKVVIVARKKAGGWELLSVRPFPQPTPAKAAKQARR